MAIRATAAASMTYQAGAYSHPPARCVAQVSNRGAKPPNSVKAPLYTREVPVERTPVGKISDKADGATPTKLATRMHTRHCTTMSVGRVGSAFSHMNSGS